MSICSCINLLALVCFCKSSTMAVIRREACNWARHVTAWLSLLACLLGVLPVNKAECPVTAAASCSAVATCAEDSDRYHCMHAFSH